MANKRKRQSEQRITCKEFGQRLKRAERSSEIGLRCICRFILA
jgi:hypothetical protein